MSRNQKYIIEFKLKIVDEYLRGLGSTTLELIYGCHYSLILQWVRKYQAHGISAFESSRKNQTYSAEFKLNVVKEYLQGGTSYRLLAVKHKIKSDAQIRNWVMMYNGYEGNLKDYNPTGGAIMTRGRKTTFEERIEIVEDCIRSGENYSATAEKYQISYNQIYRWVNVFKAQGVSALKDNRGRGKTFEDMSKVEQLEAENKLLKAKLARLEMEVDLKKKLEEVRIRLESNTENKR